MNPSEPIKLHSDCLAIEIPSGIPRRLPAGSLVRVMQSLGGSYTVTSDLGGMYRIDAKDVEALGLPPEAPERASSTSERPLNELVWEQLKTIFDPEIPVNIVDLGLIYSCVVTPLGAGENKIDIQMSMTAPGCGMADVLKADVERKLSALPEVKAVGVQVVFDPPWNPGRMSEAAKLQLGFDLDYGMPESTLPIYPQKP